MQDLTPLVCDPVGLQDLTPLVLRWFYVGFIVAFLSAVGG